MEVAEVKARLKDLLDTCNACSARGLLASAKWASDLAQGWQQLLDEQKEGSSAGDEDDSEQTVSLKGLKPSEASIYFAAKVAFDMKEYKRAAHMLRSTNGDLCTFLRCYSLFLAGENEKEEDIIDTFGPQQKATSTNPNLHLVRGLLEERRQQLGKLSSFCQYLLGVILRHMGLVEQAQEELIGAINANPLHWGAWTELGSTVQTAEDQAKLLSSNLLPMSSWVFPFFDGWLSLETQDNQRAVTIIEALYEETPPSNHVKLQLALAYYNLRLFDEAEELFQELYKNDPYMLDNVDTLSNILYVKDSKAELSHLAQRACSIDRYRPETCCVLGNYYSVRGNHEKAVLYFQRALKLDRNYLSAWTLMGHEYLELKRTAAAIQAYRRAVDLNPRDYRAWYGLGQTYEILGVSLYSLYYYQQARRLRPYDFRMWQALGLAYEQLGKLTDALDCHRRVAEIAEDPEAYLNVAEIYVKRLKPAQPEQAIAYYKMAVDKFELDEGTLDSAPDGIVDACAHLAQFYTENCELDLAEKYAQVLTKFGDRHRERGKMLLRAISSQRSAAQSKDSDHTSHV